jgi:hypothetical protein
MSEQRTPYLLNLEEKSPILTTEADTMRAELVELERRLIPLLIAVQRALGKEPSVMTRARQRIPTE